MLLFFLPTSSAASAVAVGSQINSNDAAAETPTNELITCAVWAQLILSRSCDPEEKTEFLLTERDE